MPLPILACGTKAYRQSIASTRFKALVEVTRTSVERGATPLSTHDPTGTPKIFAAQHFWREFRGQQNALGVDCLPGHDPTRSDAARQSKGVRFTALLHHIAAEQLRPRTGHRAGYRRRDVAGLRLCRSHRLRPSGTQLRRPGGMSG
jgi:hypothetical protein